MKIKDTAMGAWFRSQTPEIGAQFIARCLYRERDGIFWDIVERFGLKASTPVELGAKVLERLPEFDPDAVVEEES